MTATTTAREIRWARPLGPEDGYDLSERLWLVRYTDGSGKIAHADDLFPEGDHDQADDPTA